MILDRIEHLKSYQLPQADKILKFISENDCLKLPNEQINIDGDNLFVRVMEYVPKEASQNKFESHQVYMDVQYVVSGVELMQYTDVIYLTPETEYDSNKDYQFFQVNGPVTDLIVEHGQFAVFHPREPHRPACAYAGSVGLVKKLVFKIKI